MEDDNQISTISKPTIPIAIALIAVVIGLSALVVAISSSSRASDAEDTLTAMQDNINKAAALQVEFKDLSAKVESLISQLEDVKSANVTNVNVLSKSTKEALTLLNGEIVKNRELIANMQKVSQATTSSRTQKSAERADSSKSAQTASSATTNAEGTKTHRVRPGESFLIIAKKYGKKLSEIEKANPGVDSRKLNIGQEIIIP